MTGFEVEIRRQDAHYCVWQAIELQGLAEDVRWAAKMGMPEIGC
jgi:hypothetical protein